MISQAELKRLRALQQKKFRGESRRFLVQGRKVVAEVLAILVGVLLLGTTGNGAYLPAWTLVVVGLHFVPFVGIFRAPILRLAAVLCVLIGAASVFLGLTGAVPAPTVAGIGGGVALLGVALAALRVAGPEGHRAASA